jgi:hypothetical protein
LVAALIAAASATAFGVVPLATLRVASGLSRPVFVTAPPGDVDRLFIIEKRGIVKILNLPTGVVNATSFMNIDALVGGGTSNNSERGLLGFEFHPDYGNNGFFYVNYTNNSGDTVIARYTVSGDPDIADAASAFVLLTIDQPQANHNGGWIGFGPNDGFLYIATGDGGNYCDTGSGHTSGTGNAQDITDNLLGKILRIDVDGDDFPADPNRNYAIPPDNPFVGTINDDEIWAYGLRNPWRCGFDRQTGDLYIGDVGQDAREEIDFQPAASTGGENYGWRCMEGDVCSSASGCSPTGCECGSLRLTMPILAYSHSPPPPPAGYVCSVISGYPHRGCAIPSLAGTYFFADFCSGPVWSFVVVGGMVTDYTDRTGELSPSLGGFTVNQISSFGEDARGEQYIVDQGSGSDGQIFKIVPENDQPADINGDGIIDLADVDILVQVLLGLDPGDDCLILRADVNADGEHNGHDITAWLEWAL